MSRNKASLCSRGGYECQAVVDERAVPDISGRKVIPSAWAVCESPSAHRLRGCEIVMNVEGVVIEDFQVVVIVTET